MKNNVDKLLRQALSPNLEPDYLLNERVLRIIKEKRTMKKNYMGKSLVAAIAIVMVMASSVGVYAAWKYLVPSQVAEKVSDMGLAKAFQTEDAIYVNETQEFEKYKVTLLGIVSGENLSAHTTWDEQGKVVADRTYIVTAIENTDGTPRPDIAAADYGADTFYVSPYIQALSMIEYNIHTFGGGYTEDVIDGIQYRIIECDNIEMFAYKNIYLGVSEGVAPNVEAFSMDDETGEITRNVSYDGLNALFVLPIPTSKGNETAANAYVTDMEMSSEESVTVTDEKFDVLQNRIKDWEIEDFEENAMQIYEQELIPDGKGCISYNYQFEEHSSDANISVEYLFPETEQGLSACMEISTDTEGWEDYYIETFELLESGNVMLRVYKVN